MKRAKIRLFWMRSLSTDVVRQNLQVFVDAGSVVDVELPATAEEFVFEAPEKSQVHCTLTASDEVNTSKPATLDFDVPDLGVPVAPDGLFFEVVEIIDDEPPTDLPPILPEGE